MDDQFKGHKYQFEPLSPYPRATQVWYDDDGYMYASFDSAEVIFTTEEAENLMNWIKDNIEDIIRFSRRRDG